MAKRLRLGEGFLVPVDFASEGIAVVGMRGSGKSNTEARFAEVLYDAGVPFVAVDPKGDWWGVRSSADGKGAGLSVPVFGGLHGDFPLEPSLGNRIADLIADENLSAVLDVSRLPKTTGRATFLTAFFNRLIYRHQEEPQVRTIILEEAHTYIPQQVKGSMAELKEAAASILLEGRSWGLGCWACTQRPARINKDVLEEVGTTIIHRIGPSATNDRRTIREWVKHHELAEDIVESLTRLADGEAWVLAPHSLDFVGRVQMDRRQTFDSAATPKVGAAVRRPARLADIDAGAIKDALAESIERAKADDPKELRKLLVERDRAISAMEGRLRAMQSEVDAAQERAQEPVDLSVALSAVAEVDLALEAVLGSAREGLRTALAVLEEESRGDRRDDVPRKGQAGRRPRGVERQAPSYEERDGFGRGVRRTPSEPHRPAQRPDPASRRDAGRPAASGAEEVNRPRQAILDGLAWYRSVGVEPVSRSHLAFVAGTSPNSSGYEKNLSTLRTAGLVDYPAGGFVSLTDAGSALAEPTVEIATTAELLDVLESRLGRKKGAILRALVTMYPDDVGREELAERLGVSDQSSGYEKNLSSLRTLGLIDYPRPGRLVARDVLFI